jgi:hypothetical protein
MAMEMGLGLVIDIHFSLTELEQKVQSYGIGTSPAFQMQIPSSFYQIFLANNLLCSTSLVCSKYHKVLSMPICECESY